MTLTQYRSITRTLYDNAVAGGTDNTTDNNTVDPNLFLVTPLNEKAQLIMAILVSILTVLLIFKEIKRLS